MAGGPVGFQSKLENCIKAYRWRRRDESFAAKWCHGKVAHNAPVPEMFVVTEVVFTFWRGLD